MIIDGANCILGRVATFTVKKALSGESIDIINAEQMIITGNPKAVIANYRKIFFDIKDVAQPVHSPHVSKRPDLFVKRSIRGMLPRKRTRGIEAFKRIRAYIGDNGMKGEKVCEHKNPDARYITILDLCKAMGWKG